VSVGGPLSWSQETRVLNAIEFRLRQLIRAQSGRGPKPKPIPDPPYASERAAKRAAMDRKAQAYLRRQADREEA
jgi:hypothetical protein